MALNNEVRLIGFSGARPKPIATQSGVALTVVSVYTLDTHQQSQDQHSERHRCVFLGANANRACLLIEAGSHLHLFGYLRYHTYTHPSGVLIRSSEILVEDFLLSPKEKATAMFTRNLREMLQETDLHTLLDDGVAE